MKYTYEDGFKVETYDGVSKLSLLIKGFIFGSLIVLIGSNLFIHLGL
jgi:hypothetical protein